MALVLNHLVDALLEGVLRDEAVDEDVLVLPDTVSTVCSLRLDGRVPPEVIADDMTGVLPRPISSAMMLPKPMRMLRYIHE